MNYDLIVIGGGPAGYVAAIRAAQLGKRVACVERERAGGTCLNWGCIPTKALLAAAEVYDTVTRRAAEFGITTGAAQADWTKVIARSRSVSERLSNGISFLFRKNKVEFISGTASVPAAGQVRVTAADGSEQVLQTANILIATGARSRELPSMPFGGRIISSREALVLPEQPKSLIVIGSGAIGTELSYIYHSFGTQVTLLEALPRLLPTEDDDISAALERSFRAQGITCHTGAAVQSVSDTGSGVRAVFTTAEGGEQTLEADYCLVAAGVVPVVPEVAGLELDARGFIKTDARYQSSVKGVYAAGDCIGGVLLAHTASYEAVQAVQGMFDATYTPLHPVQIPSCTYCRPQVASIGARERELKAAGTAYKVGKFPFRGIGRAVASGESEGFVKLLFGQENGELLGAHIIGPEATELIAAPGLALSGEFCEEDIEAMIYAHPTLGEAVHEAVLAAAGRAIHN